MCYRSSQEKQQHALSLVTEAGEFAGTDDSSPAAEIFRTLVSTFRSNVDDFMLRAEQRYKELETLVNVHGFCEQVCAVIPQVLPPVSNISPYVIDLCVFVRNLQ